MGYFADVDVICDGCGALFDCYCEHEPPSDDVHFYVARMSGFAGGSVMVEAVSVANAFAKAEKLATSWDAKLVSVKPFGAAPTEAELNEAWGV